MRYVFNQGELAGKPVKIELYNVYLDKLSMFEGQCRRCNIEVTGYDGFFDKPVDYQAKYNELRSTIATQLEALKPWYIAGKVGSPMDAVTALNNIDKAVSQ